MEFVHNGIRHSLDAATVASALRGGAPEDVRAHWVEVDGVRWPPKQALALATGLDRSEFTSHRALDVLSRLGFPTSQWRAGRRTAPGPRAVPSHATVSPQIGVRSADDATDVVLVGCSGSKADAPAPAAELFTGTAFRKARDVAIRSGKPWYVLSAKFGLLDPDEVIAPYDVYLPNQSARYRTAWAAWVVAQLGERHELRGLVVEAHAGTKYCQSLVEPLAEAGAVLVQPLAGLPMGKRLSWYGSTAGGGAAGTPPETAANINWLLDIDKAVSPAQFLAGGRPAANAPGLYTWWVDVDGSHALSGGLGHRIAPGLIYAGRAGGVRPSGRNSTNTLWGRIATMHLGGNREFSTFRLTLAACLSDPERVPITESDLTAWMHQHLRVAILPLPPEMVTAGEACLLEVTDAPLNLRDVPSTPLRRSLSSRRSALARMR